MERREDRRWEIHLPSSTHQCTETKTNTPTEIDQNRQTEGGPPLPDPANNYSVTVADAHSHSVAQSGIPGGSKIDAALSALQALEDQTLPTFVTTDTWTITITQP
jgi:hypothetical protein